jgi:hypothetical protein
MEVDGIRHHTEYGNIVENGEARAMTPSELPMIADIRSGLRGRSAEPLWKLLPGEAALTPRALDGSYGLDRQLVERLLSAGAAEALFWEIAAHTDERLLPPTGKRYLLSGHVHIDSRADFERSAETIGAKDGALIIYSEGMDAFLLSVAAVVASLFVRRGSSSNAAPLTRVGRWLGHQLSWATSVVKRPYSLPVYPDDEQVAVAEDFFRATKRFVLAHEMAHIMAAHVWQPLPGDLDAAPAAQRARERDADALGQAMLVTASGPGQIDILSMLAGIDLFLKIQELIEKFTGRPPGPSHPPAAERLAGLHAERVAMGLTSRATNLALQVCRMLDDLTPHVLEYADATPVDGQPRGELYRTLFLGLLSDFDTDHPDYRAFARGAEQLLDEAPAAVLGTAQQQLRVARDVLRDGDRSEAGRARRRQRLISSFASDLPPDVRTQLGVD